MATIIVAVILCPDAIYPAAPDKSAEKDMLYYVSRVIDGDTIELSGGQKVRLIGIDTPEVHYSSKLVKDARRQRSDIDTIRGLGRKASSFTKKLCLNKKVRLEFDVERHDRYRRTLAYVFLEDGTFVNGKIIEDGYANTMTVPPNVKYADYFLKLEREARNGRRGLWA